MAKKGHSSPNLWGGENYYDQSGKKTGYSMKNGWGGVDYYDANNKKIGQSIPNGLDGYNYYDKNGKKTGYSLPNVYDGQNLYGTDGKKKGHSDRARLVGQNFYDDTASEGCYIATCVYGSYDCPEVWTLRRFRDDTLGSRFPGRLFIRTYYALAPMAVKWFGDSDWFRNFWKCRLDSMVRTLHGKGVADTPYQDRNWRK